MLIVNFEARLLNDAPRMRALAGQIAFQLEEDIHHTFLLHVSLPSSIATTAEGAQLTVTHEMLLEEAILETVALGHRPEKSVALAAAAPFTPDPGLGLGLGQAGSGVAWVRQTQTIPLNRYTLTNLNRLAEAMLNAAGLTTQFAAEPEEGAPEREGAASPVVIIPPSSGSEAGVTSALGLFLGHAITHYLHDTPAHSPLYVLSQSEPLELQEWD
jgi:hypothetical protein